MGLLRALGAAMVLGGFLVLFQQGLAFDFSYTVVTLVGALAVVQGLRYAGARRNTESRSIDPGEPERRYQSTVPGDDVDKVVREVAGRGHASIRRRERVRDRVREVVVDELVNSRNLSTDEAEELVERGEWTDDPVAAAFLSPELSYPLGERLRVQVLGGSLYRHGMTHALAAANPEVTADE